MSSHIHYLSALLVLFAIIYPTSFVGILMRLNLGNFNALFPNALVYLILSVLCYFTGYIGIVKYKTNVYFYFIALISSTFCIYLEFLEGKLAHFIKYHFWPKKIKIHESMNTNSIIFDIFVIAIGAIGEEIIFRQTFFNIVYTVLGFNIYIVIILSSLVYAINHMYFGTNAVLQKFITGMIYSSLFVLSGYVLIVPVIVHFSQNMILYFLALIGSRENIKTEKTIC